MRGLMFTGCSRWRKAQIASMRDRPVTANMSSTRPTVSNTSQRLTPMPGRNHFQRPIRPTTRPIVTSCAFVVILVEGGRKVKALAP